MPRLKKRRSLPLRRKREGRTDYRKRLQLLVSRKPRLVVRKSLKNVGMQLVEYGEKGDKIMVHASTKELEQKFGWVGARRNTPAAYLTGYLVGLKAKQKKILAAVADLGLQRAVNGAIIFAAVKGVNDAGVAVPLGKEMCPSDDRISGKHLKNVKFAEVKQKIEAAFKK